MMSVGCRRKRDRGWICALLSGGAAVCVCCARGGQLLGFVPGHTHTDPLLHTYGGNAWAKGGTQYTQPFLCCHDRTNS